MIVQHLQLLLKRPQLRAVGRGHVARVGDGGGGVVREVGDGYRMLASASQVGGHEQRTPPHRPAVLLGRLPHDEADEALGREGAEELRRKRRSNCFNSAWSS